MVSHAGLNSATKRSWAGPRERQLVRQPRFRLNTKGPLPIVVVKVRAHARLPFVTARHLSETLARPNLDVSLARRRTRVGRTRPRRKETVCRPSRIENTYSM